MVLDLCQSFFDRNMEFHRPAVKLAVFNVTQRIERANDRQAVPLPALRMLDDCCF